VLRNVPGRTGAGAASYDDAVDLPGFHIEIVTQGWLGPDGPDAEDSEAALNDLCSHGDIRLVIGAQTIASGRGRRVRDQ
jgi:hypothetical protein